MRRATHVADDAIGTGTVGLSRYQDETGGCHDCYIVHLDAVALDARARRPNRVGGRGLDTLRIRLVNRPLVATVLSRLGSRVHRDAW